MRKKIEYCKCSPEPNHKELYTSTIGNVCCVKCMKVIEGCINCRSHISLSKHPWNSSEKLKGRISEDTGLFACTVENEMDGNRRGVVFDYNGGSCEVFTLRKQKKPRKN